MPPNYHSFANWTENCFILTNRRVLRDDTDASVLKRIRMIKKICINPYSK